MTDSVHLYRVNGRRKVEQVCFQVTLLQVTDLQWDATGAVLGLMASNSGLSLAPSSRPACGVLTIDTAAALPALADALGVVHNRVRLCGLRVSVLVAAMAPA